jgi:hypothetical protein
MDANKLKRELLVDGKLKRQLKRQLLVDGDSKRQRMLSDLVAEVERLKEFIK